MTYESFTLDKEYKVSNILKIYDSFNKYGITHDSLNKKLELQYNGRDNIVEFIYGESSKLNNEPNEKFSLSFLINNYQFVINNLINLILFQDIVIMDIKDLYIKNRNNSFFIEQQQNLDMTTSNMTSMSSLSSSIDFSIIEEEINSIIQEEINSGITEDEIGISVNQSKSTESLVTQLPSETITNVISSKIISNNDVIMESNSVVVNNSTNISAIVIT
jgi:hypothetical protein